MKRKIAMVMAAMLAATGGLAGCSSAATSNESAVPAQTEETAASEASADLPEDLKNLDMSDHVTLEFAMEWQVDNTDREMVVDKINEYIADKLNCDIDITMCDFTRYPMIVNSGEEVDMIWAASWLNVFDYAKQGGFQDVKELMENKFPNLLDTVYSKDDWDRISVDDGYYIIPGHNTDLWSSNSQWGIVWRDDLRKELGCEPITDWETMEAYAEAVKAAYPEVYPWHENVNGGLWHSMLEKYHIYTEYGYGTNTLYLDLDTLETGNFTSLDSVKEYATTIRRWVENGYVQPDIASNTDDAVESFISGKYAGSTDAYISSFYSQYLPRAQEAHPDWDVRFMSYGEMFGLSIDKSVAMTCAAIPMNSKNAERTLAFIELMLTDDYLYDLVNYGVEGVHYEIDPETGYYKSLQGNNVTYANGNNFGSIFINYDAVIPSEQSILGEKYKAEKLDPVKVDNFWADFQYDASSYDEYVSSTSAAMDQYWTPILTGAYADVDAALEEATKQMEAAGVLEIQKALEPQWEAYVQEKGITGLGK